MPFFMIEDNGGDVLNEYAGYKNGRHYLGLGTYVKPIRRPYRSLGAIQAVMGDPKRIVRGIYIFVDKDGRTYMAWWSD